MLVVFIHADRYQCTGATITFEIVLSVANSLLQRRQGMNKLISHFPRSNKCFKTQTGKQCSELSLLFQYLG